MESAPLDFLQDNLESSILERETRDEIRAASSSGSEMRTRDGWPIYVLERQGCSYALDGPLHFSIYERFGKEQEAVVVLFGLGLGNTARSLRAAGVKVALVYEPDPSVVRHFFERGPSDLRDLPIVTHARELETVWSRIIGDRDNVHVADTPGYDRAFAQERAMLTANIAELLERNLVNEQTLRVRGKVWIQDIIENAKYIPAAPSAHHLQGAYQGVPAFIVGAGPSLEKNVERLKEAGQRGIVFAVNSSGKALDLAGVKPQVLACLESIDVSHLIKDLSFIDDVARLYSLSAHPSLFETGKGPLMTLFELLPHIAGPFESFFGRPGIPVCGSVSTACFSLAYRMGCSPIVLVGQDLAYTDGRCYAPGTVYEDSTVKFSEDGKSLSHDWCETMVHTHEAAQNDLLPGQKLQRVPAWGGQGEVHTAGTFSHVHAWFERIAALLLRSDGPQLINATEGGASISGFEELPLEAVLRDLPERNITPQEIVETAASHGPALGVGDVVNLFRTHQKGAEAVATAARVMAQASQAAENDWDSPDHALVSRRLRELQYAEAELKSVVNRWPWVDAWAWDAVDEALEKKPSEENASEALQGIRSERMLGEAIMESALELAQCLERKHLELKKN